MYNNERKAVGFCKTIEVPTVRDARGDLSFIEGGSDVPFEIKRVYYLYNVPTGSERGGHAHRKLEQVIFAISGSCRVTVNDGRSQSDFLLNNPRQGLHIGQLIWRTIDSFSQGCVCMVIASQPYDEDDYYRSYEDFLKEVTEA